MLDKNYNVKIIDWGGAAPVEGHDGKGFLFDPKGAIGYNAPEIRRQKYRGRQADLYALGVILFAFIMRGLPFGDTQY